MSWRNVYRRARVCQEIGAIAKTFTESTVEDDALLWLDELRYAVLHGLVIAPGEAAAVETD